MVSLSTGLRNSASIEQSFEEQLGNGGVLPGRRIEPAGYQGLLKVGRK